MRTAGSFGIIHGQKKLYIMCGVCFSGKSTLAIKIAEHKKAALVSQDDIWFTNKEEWNLNMDSEVDWERIQRLSRAEIRRKLAEGTSVAYDDLGLKYESRQFLRILAGECEAEAVLVYVDTPRTVQQRRQINNLETMQRRDVPAHLIAWGWVEFEVPQETEKPYIFRPDTDLAEWLSALP